MRGVKPDTGCARQLPGEAPLLTNSPGEENVYKQSWRGNGL